MQRTDKGGGRDSQESAVPGGLHENVSAGVDLRRRRMMRGAAVAVPALVTLRSGGLAAASVCPGQVAGVADGLNATSSPAGFFQNFTTPGVRTAPHTGDYCYTRLDPGSCTFPLTQSASGDAGVVASATGPTGLPGYTCTGYSTAGNPQTVYILTHSSAVSIV